MRHIILLALLPFLVACGKPETVDCTGIDFEASERCFEGKRDSGWATALIACFPFSQPLTTQGVWVVGFEKNDFFEGLRRPPEEVLWTDHTGAELIVDEAIFQPTNETRAFEVAVRGRRALCPMDVINPYPIAVETLQIKRQIA